MSTIKVTVDTTTSEVNMFCFSGGEVQVLNLTTLEEIRKLIESQL